MPYAPIYLREEHQVFEWVVNHPIYHEVMKIYRYHGYDMQVYVHKVAYRFELKYGFVATEREDRDHERDR